MASAKFKGNRCKIDGEIAENHAIQLIIFNLSGIMSFRTNTCWRFVGEDGACSNTGARSHPAGNSELRATW